MTLTIEEKSVRVKKQVYFFHFNALLLAVALYLPTKYQMIYCILLLSFWCAIGAVLSSKTIFRGPPIYFIFLPLGNQDVRQQCWERFGVIRRRVITILTELCQNMSPVGYLEVEDAWI